MIYPLYIVIHLLNNWGLDYLSLQSCPVDCIPVAAAGSSPWDKRGGGGGQSPWAWPPLAPPLDLPLCSLCCWGSTRVRVKMLKICTSWGERNRASDILRGCGPAKFRHFREIPQNSPKSAKYHEFHQKYFQIHVGKTYLILILAIRPVLFTPNVQIYLETSSPQRVNNVPKLPGVLRWTLQKSGH